MISRRPARKPKLSLLIDPRFSGGTSSAVARELFALAPHVDLQVFALETRMFKGRHVNPKLQDALDDLGLELTWNPKVVRGEFVAIHNPSFLKFDESLDLKIVCDTVFVVTHENLLRPCGKEGFDVKLCLDLLDRALLCKRQILVPVSGYNGDGVRQWMQDNLPVGSRWSFADFRWFNICDFETGPPCAQPRDRRGRHSRAGFEKFPALDVMNRTFPAHAEHCAILGGDSFLLDADQIPDHWKVYSFGDMPVDEFLEGIDFFVYYTHPHLQESFGRVIAEAIAAGKVVITDARTGRTFGDAVICCDPADVDGIIADLVADPQRYQDFVLQSQQSLKRFGSQVFVAQTVAKLLEAKEAVHDFF